MEWHQVSPEKAEDFLINLIKNYAANLDTFSYPSLSVIMNKIETGQNIASKLKESFRSKTRRGRLVKEKNNVVSAFDDASKAKFPPQSSSYKTFTYTQFQRNGVSCINYLF